MGRGYRECFFLATKHAVKTAPVMRLSRFFKIVFLLRDGSPDPVILVFTPVPRPGRKRIYGYIVVGNMYKSNKNFTNLKMELCGTYQNMGLVE